MFGRRKKSPEPLFDHTGMIPVIRASICTGEQVAGFKDPSTGKFREVMLIRDSAGLQEFLRQFGVKEGDIRREW